MANNLTAPQVAALAKQHGFSDREAIEIAAIAMTESRGDPQARQPGGSGRGLIQIDLGQHPDVTEAQAYNADWSMDWLKRNGGPFKVTFYGPRDNKPDAAKARNEAARAVGGGSWLSFLPKLSGIPDHAIENGGPSIGDIPNPLGAIKDVYDIVKFVPKLAVWILNPHNWIRILEGTLGFIAIFVGLGQLGNQQVTNVAKKIPNLIMKGA